MLAIAQTHFRFPLYRGHPARKHNKKEKVEGEVKIHLTYSPKHESGIPMAADSSFHGQYVQTKYVPARDRLLAGLISYGRDNTLLDERKSEVYLR